MLKKNDKSGPVEVCLEKDSLLGRWRSGFEESSLIFLQDNIWEASGVS